MRERDKFPPTDMRPKPTHGNWPSLPRPLVRLAGYSLGVMLVVGVAALGLWLAFAHQAQPPPVVATSEVVATTQPVDARWQRPVVTEAGLTTRSGVRIAQVAVSGGGGLIDLRFQVIDPDKAAVLHDQSTPPIIVDEASGLVVDQLLMGHSHTDRFQAGLTYYLIFENPGNLLQPGARVSVLLGNAEVDHVDVK